VDIRNFAPLLEKVAVSYSKVLKVYCRCIYALRRSSTVDFRRLLQSAERLRDNVQSAVVMFLPNAVSMFIDTLKSKQSKQGAYHDSSAPAKSVGFEIGM
jgi:hypothetical protein